MKIKPGNFDKQIQFRIVLKKTQKTLFTKGITANDQFFLSACSKQQRKIINH